LARIARRPKAGKSADYVSVPLTSAGYRNFTVNREGAESAKTALEKRFNAANPDNDGTIDAKELKSAAGKSLARLLK